MNDYYIWFINYNSSGHLHSSIITFYLFGSFKILWILFGLSMHVNICQMSIICIQRITNSIREYGQVNNEVGDISIIVGTSVRNISHQHLDASSHVQHQRHKRAVQLPIISIYKIFFRLESNDNQNSYLKYPVGWVGKKCGWRFD